MASKQTIEERIAHFLRLAEDSGATQAERDTAAAQAERLMIKHAISSIDLTTGLPRAEQIVTRNVFFAGSLAVSRMANAFEITYALKLKCWHQSIDASTQRFRQRWAGLTGPSGRAYPDPLRDHASGRVAAGELFTVVGYESDVRDAVELISSVDVQAAVALKHWWRSDGKPRIRRDYWADSVPTQERHAKQAYLESFGRGAARRINEMRNRIVLETEREAPGTAVALIDREQAVKDWVSENTNLTAGRGRISRHSAAGFAAGQSANVGGRGLGAGQRSIAR